MHKNGGRRLSLPLNYAGISITKYPLIKVSVRIVLRKDQNKAVDLMRKPSMAALGIMDESGMVVDAYHSAYRFAYQ